MSLFNFSEISEGKKKKEEKTVFFFRTNINLIKITTAIFFVVSFERKHMFFDVWWINISRHLGSKNILAYVIIFFSTDSFW